MPDQILFFLRFSGFVRYCEIETLFIRQICAYSVLLLEIYSLGFAARLIASLTADPGVASLIPARSHTFVEIDHEIISTLILLLTLIQEGLLSVTSKSMCTKYW